MESGADDPVRLLDNIIWNTLTGPHAKFSSGTDKIRRYARGFSPLIGARDRDDPDFAGLAGCCAAGEQFYRAGWSADAPPRWRVDVDSTMEQYLWAAPSPVPAEPSAAIRLGPEHAAQALALVALTHPGPFAERTPELGDYFGIFEGEKLIAMAGERMHAGVLREISGVCTHPDFQGRGHARKLMERIVALQLARGQIPFLHVMSANATARSLYERMGFRRHQQMVIRVVTFLG